MAWRMRDALWGVPLEVLAAVLREYHGWTVGEMVALQSGPLARRAAEAVVGAGSSGAQAGCVVEAVRGGRAVSDMTLRAALTHALVARSALHQLNSTSAQACARARAEFLATLNEVRQQNALAPFLPGGADVARRRRRFRPLAEPVPPRTPTGATGAPS